MEGIKYVYDQTIDFSVNAQIAPSNIPWGNWRSVHCKTLIYILRYSSDTGDSFEEQVEEEKKKEEICGMRSVAQSTKPKAQ